MCEVLISTSSNYSLLSVSTLSGPPSVEAEDPAWFEPWLTSLLTQGLCMYTKVILVQMQGFFGLLSHWIKNMFSGLFIWDAGCSCSTCIVFLKEKWLSKACWEFSLIHWLWLLKGYCNFPFVRGTTTKGTNWNLAEGTTTKAQGTTAIAVGSLALCWRSPVCHYLCSGVLVRSYTICNCFIASDHTNQT